jgi:hypothetical protein
MRTLSKRIGRGSAALVLAGALAAAALAASTLHLTHRSAATGFSLSVEPHGQTIAPGGTARYLIRVHRRRYRGRVALALQGLPAHASAVLHPSGRSGQRLTVTVITSSLTPTRSYSMRLYGSGGRFGATVSLSLNLVRPRSPAFALTGSATAPLMPGVSQPLDVTISNPNDRPILLRGMTVSVGQLNAPLATDAHPCTLEDFAVQQYTGPYPLVVQRLSARTLGAIGIPAQQWPQVILLNRLADQDGCQRATIRLSYHGSAMSP